MKIKSHEYLERNELLKAKVSNKTNMNIFELNILKKIVIYMTTELKAPEEIIIKDFDDKIKLLYCQEDKDKGFIDTPNRQGQKMRYPIMSISIAVLSNERRILLSHVQVAEIAAEWKKKAKAVTGSTYVKDTRNA